MRTKCASDLNCAGLALDWAGLDWRLDWRLDVDWIGLGWTGLDWIGLYCIGLDWTGLDWIGLDWTGLDLDLHWIGFGLGTGFELASIGLDRAGGCEWYESSVTLAVKPSS